MGYQRRYDNRPRGNPETYDNENDIIRLNDEVKNQGDRIIKLEDSNKWLARTVAAAIITAVIGVLVVVFRMGAGI